MGRDCHLDCPVFLSLAVEWSGGVTLRLLPVAPRHHALEDRGAFHKYSLDACV